LLLGWRAACFAQYLMGNRKKSPKKLKVSRETLAALAAEDLAIVFGGATTSQVLLGTCSGGGGSRLGAKLCNTGGTG
jgi:hypothetical protein